MNELYAIFWYHLVGKYGIDVMALAALVNTLRSVEVKAVSEIWFWNIGYAGIFILYRRVLMSAKDHSLLASLCAKKVCLIVGIQQSGRKWFSLVSLC